MVQIRGAKKGLSIHTRTHLHLPRRCRYARRSCAELASSTPGTRRRGHGSAQPLPAVPLSPPPPRPVLQPSAPGGTGNPSPKPTEKKKMNTKLPLPSTPSPATLQKGGRYQLAACCRRQETLGAECSLRDGRAPRARHRAPLMAALPPAQPQAGTEHRAPLLPPGAAALGSLRHGRHGKLVTSGAAAAAHIGSTGRDGAGRGGDSA